MDANLARICYMYYEQGLTQQDISARLRISRIKVSRLLKQARDEGIVRFRIKFSGYFPDLERELGDVFPDVVFQVVSSIDDTDGATIATLGSTCAEYLSDTLEPGDAVAVGWGRTLMATAKHLEASLPDVTFVPIIGGHAEVGMDMHANSVAGTMARSVSGKSLSILAPALAGSVAERETLMATSAVSVPLGLAKKATICVFSVGSPSNARSAMGSAHYHSVEDADALVEQGAVCDLASISYFDANKRRVGQNISARAVSLSESELLAIPQRVCVAGGSSKHDALRVALELRIPTTVITDDITARALLNQ